VSTPVAAPRLPDRRELAHVSSTSVSKSAVKPSTVSAR